MTRRRPRAVIVVRPPTVPDGGEEAWVAVCPMEGQSGKLPTTCPE